MNDPVISDAENGAVVPESARGAARQGPRGPRPKKRDVNGWLILDKPVGMTSTHAVAVAKRLFNAKKAGHAGTLDPLASGILPIAFGEATKTVPFVMDGRKAYRFTVAWGEERDTDDSEGVATATSALRPDADSVRAVLSQFTGTLMQTPPRYSAIKIAGERAYDLAREGEHVELQPRQVEIVSLALAAHQGDTSTFEAQTGKGAYVRALARDIGRTLGCLGHIVSLRRARVGAFTEAAAMTIDDLTALGQRAPSGETDLTSDSLVRVLLPVAAALDDVPSLAVSAADAARLKRGQGILLRGRDAPVLRGVIYITCQGELIALAEVEQGEAHPTRVFNLAAGG